MALMSSFAMHYSQTDSMILKLLNFTVSKIVSTTDRISNKQCRNEKKRKLSDSTAEKPAESSTVDVTSTTC
ncbi:hypothetical protein P3S67_005604 [Capsicum chacoense]